MDKLENKINVAVILGGRSPEREISLLSGNAVFNALDRRKYNVEKYDPRTDITRLASDADRIDFAFIALHGLYGEDGALQGLLEFLKIPYQGTGVLGSALAINKVASKILYENAGLATPPYKAFRRNETISSEKLIRDIGFPMMIKPATGGSSIDISLIRLESEIEPGIRKAFDHDTQILVEKFIVGMEVTAGVIGNDTPEVFPLLEVVLDDESPFLDYHAKYFAKGTKVIIPARIRDEECVRRLKTAALTAHRCLFCSGYSRTDMILTDDTVYVLETNTIPGMTEASDYPKVAYAGGYTFATLLDRLIELGVERKRESPTP